MLLFRKLDEQCGSFLEVKRIGLKIKSLLRDHLSFLLRQKWMELSLTCIYIKAAFFKILLFVQWRKNKEKETQKWKQHLSFKILWICNWIYCKILDVVTSSISASLYASLFIVLLIVRAFVVRFLNICQVLQKGCLKGAFEHHQHVGYNREPALLVRVTCSIHPDAHPFWRRVSQLQSCLIRILLLRAGVESNPGPSRGTKYDCCVCHKNLGNNATSVECSKCQNWWHLRKKDNCSQLKSIRNDNVSYICPPCKYFSIPRQPPQHPSFELQRFQEQTNGDVELAKGQQIRDSSVPED